MRSGDAVREVRSVPSRRSHWAAERLHPRQVAGQPGGARLSVRASAIRPGDYLPPQPCLDPTAWQDSGFPVAASADAVCSAPMHPWRVLLFGPLGVLDSMAEDAEVTVIRAATSPT